MIIRRFSIKVLRFVYNEIPAHQRGYSNLVNLFRGLLFPFKVLADEWKVFRDKSITRAKVTGETASLEWYLNELFDPTTRGITIDTAGSSGEPAGDIALEPAIFLIAGDEATEYSYNAVMGVKGEGTVYQGRSFAVFVPVAVAASDDEIKAIVNQYRFAGKTYLVNRV